MLPHGLFDFVQSHKISLIIPILIIGGIAYLASLAFPNSKKISIASAVALALVGFTLEKVPDYLESIRQEKEAECVRSTVNDCMGKLCGQNSTDLFKALAQCEATT